MGKSVKGVGPPGQPVDFPGQRSGKGDGFHALLGASLTAVP